MMNKPKIAIILSSTRDSRFADVPAKWVQQAVRAHGELDAELVDLREFDLPFFNEKATNAWVPTENPEGRRWQKKVAGFDGYIFITAEYNRSIPAVLKNAIDYAYNEWNRKPAAYVGYGSVGGARAVEHLRMISVELQMAPMRTGVHIGGSDFFAVSGGKSSLDQLEHLKPGLQEMLDQLTWWTHALRAARERDTRRAAA